MRLHNTLTRKVEEFKPIKPGEVILYTCGPTVYNYYQIGNLRNAIFNDTLRRVLTAAGYRVKHVMNITDVGHLVSDADEGEDKLEKGARREGKSVWEVAEHYTEAFKHDMTAINVLPPNGYHSPEHGDTYARATEFIDAQINMVQVLLDKDFAYQTKEAIYFDVTKLPDYGALSGQKLSEKEIAVRPEVVTDPDKRHPFDFSVWFFAAGNFAEHTMQWRSPWGDGFPGWHLECSAIIHATLGDPIDIHTGGVDHIGTHHPNEMAQTEAAFGHPLAHYWLHNEFLLVDGTKMSKSKNNSYLLRDITEHGFAPLAYRLLTLQAHYRTEINFTWESLEAAQNTLLGLYSWADLIHQGQPAGLPSSWQTELMTHLSDDLNTPEALAKLHSWTSTHSPTAKDLEELDAYFGLHLAHRPDITPGQKQLIAHREEAREAKHWATADSLRDELAAHHLEVSDTAAGPIWRRTTV